MTIGYDSLASLSSTRADFGEVDLQGIPFKSFEIRGADKGGQDFLSKPFVSYWFSGAPFTKYSSINIRSENFPVKLYWKPSPFEHDDREWTHFTRFWNYMFHPNPFDEIIRLNENSEFLITKEYLRQTEGFRNSYIHEVEGGGQDTIYVVFFGFANQKPTSSTDEIRQGIMKVYPQPASDFLRIEIPDEFGNKFSFEIISLSGERVQKVEKKTDIIDVSHLKKGIYFLKAYNPEQIFVSKFIKN